MEKKEKNKVKCVPKGDYKYGTKKVIFSKRA